MSRRRGFTLIELLVVIAIIGILAAMLFPVFARARESARKIQCLSNVKNIAMAFQMYLTDYDKFMPAEHSAGAQEWLNGNCSWVSCDSGMQCRMTASNPYLREPVILEEYIKNRDVWRCASAKYENGTVAINTGIPDWLTYFKRGMDDGTCPRPRPCTTVFPPGWGGSVTDTLLQGSCGDSGTGGFVQNYAIPAHNLELSLSSVDDVAKRVVVGDGGVDLKPWRTSGFAYPDQSRYDQLLAKCGDSGNCSTDSSCGNAAVAAKCSPLSLCYGGDGKFATDVSYRKTFARHMGGSNLGFADGHAKWYDAEAILFGGWNNSGYATEPAILDGLESCFNPTANPRD